MLEFSISMVIVNVKSWIGISLSMSSYCCPEPGGPVLIHENNKNLCIFISLKLEKWKEELYRQVHIVRGKNSTVACSLSPQKILEQLDESDPGTKFFQYTCVSCNITKQGPTKAKLSLNLWSRWTFLNHIVSKNLYNVNT